MGRWQWKQVHHDSRIGLQAVHGLVCLQTPGGVCFHGRDFRGHEQKELRIGSQQLVDADCGIAGRHLPFSCVSHAMMLFMSNANLLRWKHHCNVKGVKGLMAPVKTDGLPEELKACKHLTAHDGRRLCWGFNCEGCSLETDHKNPAACRKGVHACAVCRKPGHGARTCWHRPNNKGKGKGKATGAAKE